jgi:hypothetical protein
MRKGIEIEVIAADRSRLEAIVAARHRPQKQVWRAQMILATADGCGTAAIMRRAVEILRLAVWQERLMTDGVDGRLRDKKRPWRIPPSRDRSGREAINLTVEAYIPSGSSGKSILTLSWAPPVGESIQDMAHGRGDTRDDGNKSAKRHDDAEQHECAESSCGGGGRELPYGGGGKDAQQKSNQAPQIGALRILEGANGDPSRPRQEDQDQHKFEHMQVRPHKFEHIGALGALGAFDRLREAMRRPVNELAC